MTQEHHFIDSVLKVTASEQLTNEVQSDLEKDSDKTIAELLQHEKEKSEEQTDN